MLSATSLATSTRRTRCRAGPVVTVAPSLVVTRAWALRSAGIKPTSSGHRRDDGQSEEHDRAIDGRQVEAWQRVGLERDERARAEPGAHESQQPAADARRARSRPPPVRAMRHGPPPSAARTANSWCRRSVRVRKRCVMFAHAISSTKPTAPSSVSSIGRKSPRRSAAERNGRGGEVQACRVVLSASRWRTARPGSRSRQPPVRPRHARLQPRDAGQEVRAADRRPWCDRTRVG